MQFISTTLQVIIVILSLAVIAMNLLAVKYKKIDAKEPVVISALAFHFVLFYALYLLKHIIFQVNHGDDLFMNWSLILRFHSALAVFAISFMNIVEHVAHQKEYKAMLERMQNGDGIDNA